MGQPFDIVAGPADVWVAPVGTSFPEISAAPSGAWHSLGHTDGGVEVDEDETTVALRVDQITGPVKTIRSEETISVKFSLAETTAENFAKVLNDAGVAQVAAGVGTGGYRQVNPYMGPAMAQFAMLVKGPSPYMDGGFTQYQIPIVVQSGKPKSKYTRTEKVVLETEWMAVVDPNASSPDERFGSILFQDAAPTP